MSGIFLMNFALNFLSVASSAHTISPVLLARARSIASEHSELSERLTWNYDSDIAKRVGDLSNAVMALQGWETANDVGMVSQFEFPQANCISVSDWASTIAE